MDDGRLVLDNGEEKYTWIALGTVLGILVVVGMVLLICIYWQRHSNNFRAMLMGIPFLRERLRMRRDSLDDLEEDPVEMFKKGSYTRDRKPKAVVGVKSARIMTKSGASGYRWKRKWRDRKARSKEKRRLKHIERKKRRQQIAAKKQQESQGEESSSDSSSSDETSSASK